MYINDRTRKIHAHTKKKRRKIQFTIKGPGKRKPNASGEDIENNTGTGCSELGQVHQAHRGESLARGRCPIAGGVVALYNIATYL